MSAHPAAPDLTPCPQCDNENPPSSTIRTVSHVILGASVVLMVYGTVDHDIRGVQAQRWALYLQMFGALAYLKSLARWIVSRNAQVIGFWHEQPYRERRRRDRGQVVVPFPRGS